MRQHPIYSTSASPGRKKNSTSPAATALVGTGLSDRYRSTRPFNLQTWFVPSS